MPRLPSTRELPPHAEQGSGVSSLVGRTGTRGRLERGYQWSWRNRPRCSQPGSRSPPARTGAAAPTAPSPGTEQSCGAESQSEERHGAAHRSSLSCPKLGSPASKDELQGSLDVPSGGLQGPEAQLIVVYAHVSQLLQLGLPLALRTGNKRS